MIEIAAACIIAPVVIIIMMYIIEAVHAHNLNRALNEVTNRQTHKLSQALNSTYGRDKEKRLEAIKQNYVSGKIEIDEFEYRTSAVLNDQEIVQNQTKSLVTVPLQPDITKLTQDHLDDLELAYQERLEWLTRATAYMHSFQDHI